MNIPLHKLKFFFKAIRATYYYSCCRDGNYQDRERKRKTSQTRPHQKPSRKMNGLCISRMYVNEYIDNHVEVTYISAHSGHELGKTELQYLPLPQSTKDEVATKVSIGIPADRIKQGNCNCYVLHMHAQNS